MRRGWILIVLMMLIAVPWRAQAAGPLYPVLDVDGGWLLGGVQDGKWLNAITTARQLKGGESYRLFSATAALGQAKGSKPQGDVPCENTRFVTLTPKPRNTDALGIGGTWNAQPRVPQKQAVTAAYRTAVSELLKSKGIARPEVNITAIWRVDLEGDGTTEVLLSATRLTSSESGSPQPSARPGDYSLTLLRKVVNGKVQTTLLGSNFYPNGGDFVAPQVFSFGPILDANGDGRLEFLQRAEYYEGASSGLYRMVGNQPVLTLEDGCGV